MIVPVPASKPPTKAYLAVEKTRSASTSQHPSLKHFPEHESCCASSCPCCDDCCCAKPCCNWTCDCGACCKGSWRIGMCACWAACFPCCQPNEEYLEVAKCSAACCCALSPCLVFRTYGQALTAAGITDGKQQGRMICCTGILANFFYERAGESGELADMLMACAACFLACTVMKDSRQELMQKEPVASKINNEPCCNYCWASVPGFPCCFCGMCQGVMSVILYSRSEGCKREVDGQSGALDYSCCGGLKYAVDGEPYDYKPLIKP
mmetsp:Transcript_42856/g.142639  ORF Transcript_42856/g.142639 Transcript_42856/m.142639 type:complete len:266 (+) Transcript_42856:16-813(+)